MPVLSYAEGPDPVPIPRPEAALGPDDLPAFLRFVPVPVRARRTGRAAAPPLGGS